MKNTASRLRLVIVLAVCVTGFGSISALAQNSSTPETAVPAALSPEAISELVSKMDPEQTQAFSGMVELLNNSIGAQGEVAAPATPVLDAFKQWASEFGNTLVEHIVNLPELVVAIGKSIASIFEGKTAGESTIFLLLIAAVLAVAWAAERLYDSAFVAKRDKIRQTETRSLLETLRLLSVRAMIEIGDVVVFAIVALLAAKIVIRNPDDLFVVNMLILKAILIYRLVAEILRFILAPVRTDLRLVYTDDWTAQYMFRHFSAVAGLIGIAFFLVDLFDKYQIGTDGVLRFWISFIAYVWIIFVTWKARKGLTSIILGDETGLTPGLERMAAWWPPISIFVLAMSWLLSQFILSTGYEALTPARGAISILLIIIMPFLDTIVRGVASHLVPDMKGEGAVAEKAYQNTRLCYVRIGRVILLSLMVLVIVRLWGLNFRDLTEAGLGAHIATHFVGFLLILAVGYSAWEITNLVINKKLAAEMEASGHGHGHDHEGGGEGGGVGLTRMATILPIVKLSLQATIVTLVALLALSQLGVNITPLLAGAGVLGLAIGFGAQTLVKDIVSGMFFLLDDAFRAGEYIETEGISGTVEKISVRSLQLRAVKGAIHVLPYGSISKLTNHSRDWVIMKLKFTIPFDTDIDMVRKLFKKIGQEMLEEPELADKFLEPFKGQGAADVTDVGIVVRGKFTTRPGDQWQIRKEVYNRVQRAFEENGIEFARKEVRVSITGGNAADLSADQKTAIAGAASHAAETGPSGKSGPVDDR